MYCEILGISQFCRKLGDDIEVKINGNSSAVKGILARRGYGKIKHLEVKQLWLPEQVRSGKVDIQKVSRKSNPSDGLTHHYTKEDIRTQKSSCMSEGVGERTPWP